MYSLFLQQGSLHVLSGHYSCDGSKRVCVCERLEWFVNHSLWTEQCEILNVHVICDWNEDLWLQWNLASQHHSPPVQLCFCVCFQWRVSVVGVPRHICIQPKAFFWGVIFVCNGQGNVTSSLCNDRKIVPWNVWLKWPTPPSQTIMRIFQVSFLDVQRITWGEVYWTESLLPQKCSMYVLFFFEGGGSQDPRHPGNYTNITLTIPINFLCVCIGV